MNLAKVRAVLLIFEHVLALCLEVFCLILSISYLPHFEQSPTAKFFKISLTQR